MKKAIILHGMPSKEEYYDPSVPSPSNNHWLPWVQRELLLHDVLAQTIEMPFPFAPVYEEWKKVFEKFEVNEDTILVGHSCGAGFIIRYLSENNCKVNKVASVAPWIDPAKTLNNNFFDFSIDKHLLDKASDVQIFISSDDGDDILDSVKVMTAHVQNIKLNHFDNHGHFTLNDMKTEKFPELLDFLLQ